MSGEGIMISMRELRGYIEVDRTDWAPCYEYSKSSLNGATITNVIVDEIEMNEIELLEDDLFKI